MQEKFINEIKGIREKQMRGYFALIKTPKGVHVMSEGMRGDELCVNAVLGISDLIQLEMDKKIKTAPQPKSNLILP